MQQFRQQGASLLELLVICSVIMILMAASALYWRLPRGAPTEVGAQQLAADLALLRQWSVNTAMGTSDRLYEQPVFPSLYFVGVPITGYQLLRNGAVCKTVQLPDEVVVNSPCGRQVQFNQAGRMPVGVTLTLRRNRWPTQAMNVVLDMPGRIEVRNGWM
ncbi:MAG: hypothetical protein VB133_04965 [Anaeromusa sp.]|uniref:pilus assembly FimT family protein n=1 Tax=Anaeromusa sp. TaxID=1872520 RepID=UPI002B1FFB96|nr:hypothetical protein [Anaeromusa sp.]MEA4834469.1 hypothetical protein [Anaeromusa sp.]NCB76506.1 hypothetical protein [Negativicutes bacterium]